MIELMVGDNFDNKLIEKLVDLNNKYKETGIKIAEVYGSIRENPIGTARPFWRIPDIDRKSFMQHVKLLNDNGIRMNYTINSITVGRYIDFKSKEGAIKDYLKFLEDCGVSRVTIANDLLLRFVSDNSKIPIEVSTIMHVNSTAQLDYYSKLNVNKICMNLYKNREIDFLSNFRRHAEKYNINVELMVNEFCSIGGAPCLGILRINCYINHAYNMSKEEIMIYDNFPMEICTKSRTDNPSSWLKVPFILPQWLKLYRLHTGIEMFKITGRTHATDYIVQVAEHYMSQQFDGNLLELWAHLQRIVDQSKSNEEFFFTNISCKKLDQLEFIEYWFMQRDFLCSEHCTFDCKRCEAIYDIATGRKK